MKNYDKSKESSYIQYLDANNLYGAAMSEKLPINGFKWVNDISGINKKFVKSYDKKNSDKGYILEVDVDYPSKLHKLHSDMTFLPERMKIDKTEFWYDYMRKKYGDMVKLCYTNTDSLVMNIKTKDFTKILHKMLKKGLTLQITMLIDHYLKDKIRK